MSVEGAGPPHRRYARCTRIVLVCLNGSKKAPLGRGTPNIPPSPEDVWQLLEDLVGFSAPTDLSGSARFRTEMLIPGFCMHLVYDPRLTSWLLCENAS